MEPNQVIGLYRELLGREPSEQDIQNAISSGVGFDQLREQITQSPEYGGGPPLPPITQLGQLGRDIPFNTSADRPAMADIAYALTMGTELNLPDYSVADFSPDQLQAFENARQLQGAYQPFLEEGYASTMQGIGAMGDALSGTRDAQQYIRSTTLQGMGDQGQALTATRDLAGQVPGQIAAGQQALGQASADTMRFADQGVGDARQAADASYLVGDQARGIASDVTGRARSFLSPLESDLARSTGGARGQVASGQLGADIAAQRARMSTAEAQGALQAASGFGLGSAQQGIAGLRGTAEMYSPDMIDPFMSSFEDAAVQQALADIARQGELQEDQLAAQAVQAGAFGGSRQAVAEQELARNTMEQQGRTAAQMRAAGFESAATRSQDAFERALARQQQAAQLTGQLGQMGAGSAAGAAEAGGRLGLAAEQLAQGSALQGAQLGLSAEQMAAANAQALAQTGLSIEQLASQTGMNAQQIAGQMVGQAGQLGVQAGQLGMQGAQQAGNLGLQSANLGLSGIQAGLAAQQQASGIGLTSANLGLSGIQQGLGAQQQAAGIGQGIAGLGQQQLGFGQTAQQLGLQDVSTGLQIGGQQQTQRQTQLDTDRLNQYQQAMLPLQQAAALSDLITGVPSGSMVSASQPGVSPGSQMLGLGIAGLSQFGQGGAFAPGGAFGRAA